MDILRFTAGDYDYYESLVCKKENLLKECTRLYDEYLREFGDLKIEVFSLKIDVIALKKSIAYCQAALNHGMEVNKSSMEDYIRHQMEAYKSELEDLKSERNSVGKIIATISLYEVERIKKIYRDIVKILHPDLTPLITDFPYLYNLFMKATAAYKANDLNSLEETQVLLNKFMSENGLQSISVVIENLDEKIMEIEEDIDEIVSTEPYSFKELLEDEELIEETKESFRKEIEEYETYKLQLEAVLKELTNGGDVNE